jgi:hypothetical protein
LRFRTPAFCPLKPPSHHPPPLQRYIEIVKFKFEAYIIVWLLTITYYLEVEVMQSLQCCAALTTVKPAAHYGGLHYL